MFGFLWNFNMQSNSALAKKKVSSHFQQRNRNILNLLEYYLTNRFMYILILKNPWFSINLVRSEMKDPSGQQSDFLHTNKNMLSQFLGI